MEAEELEVMPVSMVESMTRGEINSQIETAKKYPRSMDKFKKRGIEMATSDDDTAASCIYRRPVGKEEGKMKFAEGLSIRMAEIVGASYGNLRVYATLIEQTDRQVVARGMAMDLESNFASSSEVVESTVDKNGKPYTERMRAVIAKAALAKARRDATFQVVPKALAKPIEQAVRKLLMGEAKSLDKRRETVVGWIKALGINEKRVYDALAISGPADLGLDHIETLTGLRTAIKDGETTVDEAFPGETWKETAEAKAALSNKSKLIDAISKFAKNSNEGKAILKELTQKQFITNVTEEEAAKALSDFEVRYSAKGFEEGRTDNGK